MDESRDSKMFKNLTLLILGGLIFLYANSTQAQFSRYRSSSKFTPGTQDNGAQENNPNEQGQDQLRDPRDIDPRDFDPQDTDSTDQQVQITEEARPSTPPAPRPSRVTTPSEPVSSEIDEPNDTEDRANKKVFGSRVDPNAIANSPLAQKQRGKYVNLNPETAFGPEIVESFDFPDTDILELTKHMQKLTGINLILDKDVKGKVSIIAPTPITVGDAWKAYLTALNMAGFTLVKSGAFYKIINARDVRYTPTKIYTGNYTPDTENYVMRVVALKNVSAQEISRNFRPFMTRYGRIIDIKQTNTVIMADTGTNINHLVKMVKFLDVPGFEESLQIVKVKNSSAQEIAKLLDSILKEDSGGGSSARSRIRSGSSSNRFTSAGGDDTTSSASISKIIAEPRTNSIIAMANAEGAKQLKDLIKKLDVKIASSGSNRVHVYYLNYGDSEELSKTLSDIVSGNVAKDNKSSSGRSSRFSSSGNVVDNAIFSAEVKITADKNNNALVVTASPTDWLTLKDVIGRLDIPRDQVYVEGLILEANVTKNKGFGVEYVGAYGQANAQRAGFTNSGSDLFTLLGGNPTSLSGLFAGVGIGESRTVNFNGTDVKVNSVNALIKAIASHTNSNVLATPQILALDNTEATFEVGDTVPIQNSTVSNGVQAFNTTTQEAKLSLKITPQINKVTRFVKLKINQKIDDFKQVDQSIVTGGGGVPTTTRSAITEVMVKDRDTIAMGGLLRDKDTVTFNKIPLLGDIPVLGWLFKSKSRTLEKVNLLFFMTPKILAPYDKTASAHTLEVMERREKGMAGVFEGDDVDPNKKNLSELRAKVERQVEGPLFDKEDAALYKDLNKKSLRSGDEILEEEELEAPNYQEIIKSVE